MHRSNSLILFVSSALLALAIGGCAESTASAPVRRAGAGPWEVVGQRRQPPPDLRSTLPVQTSHGGADPNLSLASTRHGGIGVR